MTRRDKIRPDPTRFDRARHDKTYGGSRNIQTRRDATRRDETRPDTTRQDLWWLAEYSDETGLDTTRPDPTRQDLWWRAEYPDATRQDTTRPDETRQDKTYGGSRLSRQDEAVRDSTGRVLTGRVLTRFDKTRLLSLHTNGEPFMTENNEQKKGIQAKSADTLIIENRLRETKPGEIVTYDELSRLLGRDVRAFCQSNAQTARHTLEAESIFFDCIRSEGYKRLTSNEAAFASDSHRERISSAARRGLRHLRYVPFDELEDEAKRKHLTMSAQFGAIQLFGSSKATKKIESAVKDTFPMAIGETLKLFGG